MLLARNRPNRLPMKALANINIPKIPLLGTPEKSPEDERVLELFRNRAELKKAYSELQDEIHALKDRLKQQEGATARVQEMLEELELKLQSPETAYPAMVFYALRKLWGAGNALLVQLATELQQQYTEQESRAYFVETNRRRFEQRRALESALQAARSSFVEAEQRLSALEAERIKLAKPWHYFRRKELEDRIVIASAAVQGARGNMEPARLQFAQFEQDNQVPFPGISLEAKRNINAALIACAEILCLQLVKTPLVGMAKAASLKRVSGDDYGHRADCEALIEDVGRAIAILGQKPPDIAKIRKRAERRRAQARYRAADDCVPVAESMSATADEGEPPVPNVVAEDTWDVFKVLLR